MWIFHCNVRFPTFISRLEGLRRSHFVLSLQPFGVSLSLSLSPSLYIYLSVSLFSLLSSLFSLLSSLFCLLSSLFSLLSSLFSLLSSLFSLLSSLFSLLSSLSAVWFKIFRSWCNWLVLPLFQQEVEYNLRHKEGKAGMSGHCTNDVH